jgi:hypothetical protein
LSNSYASLDNKLLQNATVSNKTSCALVLGKALQWFTNSNDVVSNNFLPKQYKNHIKNELNKIIAVSGLLVDANDIIFNPIGQVPVIVISGDQGIVFIDVFEEFGATESMQGGQQLEVAVHAQLSAMHSHATQICCAQTT